MAAKKAGNGSIGSRQRSRSGSIPPLPPTSEAAVPSSDSLALPGPSSKKLFPLFDSKARKNGKATPQTETSDVESTATVSESSQTAAKKNKQPAANSKGKSKSTERQQSDASSSTKEKVSKPAKTSRRNSDEPLRKTSKFKSKSTSPRLPIDLDDPNITISTVASTSTSSTTPEPQKTVITITDSPVRELKSIKTFADFEAERVNKKAAKEATGWNGGREPPWPTRENVHVLPEHGHGGVLERPTWTKRDWKGKGRAVEPENDQTTNYLPSIAHEDIIPILHRYTRFDKVDEEDRSLEGENVWSEAAKERLKLCSEDDAADYAQQSWYTRYAPKSVADVLGSSNKENALYLRDWLKELTLHDPLKVLNKSRKRKVKREVTSDERKRLRKAAKRRKRKGFPGFDDDDLGDFIASDDEEEYEHHDYVNLSDDGSVPSPTKSTSSHGSHRRSAFEPLTNVILLAGPVSSGKTSAVYAVANELQWQVFEVYPGIGKRGAKDLDRYVGMVGENHIMKRDALPISNFFGKAGSNGSSSITSVNPTMNGTSKLHPVSLPAVPSESLSNPSTSANESTVKQSCIVIEEVDILFESDSGFWEGLISFVSKSRRPVILTCNDVSVVPKDSLPLQNILYFQSLDKSIAKQLLKEIVQLERREVTEDLIENILKQTSDVSGKTDVRQAINELQYVSAEPLPAAKTKTNGTSPSTAAAYDLRTVQTILENASFVDAELIRRSWMAWEDEERVPQLEKEDDEFLYHPNLPVHKLEPPPDPDSNQPLPILAREADFCEAMGVFEDECADDVLLEQQRKLCTDLQEVAEEHLDSLPVLPKNRILHLEFFPMLREIVYGDDLQEQAYNIALEIQSDDVVLDARVRRSRRLAGSSKDGYKRHLDITREVTNALKRSALPTEGAEVIEGLDRDRTAASSVNEEQHEELREEMSCHSH